MFLVYGPLRVVRGLAGLLFAFQLLALLPSLGYLGTPQASMATMAGFLAAKMAVIAVLAGIFFGLRVLINWIHHKTKGSPHPAMTKLWSV